MRRLIVNADDFGFTPGINEGIVEAHRHGIVTAATLMANGPAFYNAVLAAKDNPSLDVGVHLVLVGGRALSRPSKALPQSPSALVAALLTGGLDVEKELDLQILRVLEAGVFPTHLDTHKHTHLLPQVQKAIGKLSRAYGIAWVRRPLWGGVSRLAKWGCRTTDHLSGFRMTGKFDSAALVAMIGALNQGVTEFFCHPGYCCPELLEARTRLKESRRRELEALTDPRVREALGQHSVALTTFRDL